MASIFNIKPATPIVDRCAVFCLTAVNTEDKQLDHNSFKIKCLSTQRVDIEEHRRVISEWKAIYDTLKEASFPRPSAR